MEVTKETQSIFGHWSDAFYNWCWRCAICFCIVCATT